MKIENIVKHQFAERLGIPAKQPQIAAYVRGLNQRIGITQAIESDQDDSFLQALKESAKSDKGAKKTKKHKPVAAEQILTKGIE